jgi:glutamate racemase
MSVASIGIFDSGFGGLTVMNAVKHLMPQENIVYFGDTGNLPYGDKSADTITTYCLQNTQFLANLGIKLLIIACHTACTTAYEKLQKHLPFPVIGVMEPSVDLLLRQSKAEKIVLLGTRRTIASGVYQQKIKTQIPSSDVISLACPLFVPIVEEGFAKHPVAQGIVREYLGHLKEQKIDVALLGCTHYPLLSHFIQSELGPNVTLINPAEGCAEQARQILSDAGKLNQSTFPPHYEFYVSDNPEQFCSIGQQFLECPIKNVICVNHI